MTTHNEQPIEYTFAPETITRFLMAHENGTKTRECRALYADGQKTGLGYVCDDGEHSSPFTPQAPAHYYVIHLNTGKPFLFIDTLNLQLLTIYREETIQRILQRIAPLADWTHSERDLSQQYTVQNLLASIRLIFDQERTDESRYTATEAFIELQTVIEGYKRTVPFSETMPALERVLAYLCRQVDEEEAANL